MAIQIDLGFTGLTEASRRLREIEQATAGIARNTRAAGAGPLAQAAAARRAGIAAMATGDPGSIFDANVRLARAQASVERANRMLQGPQGLGGRLMTAISTSRFGAGGLMPLVGRTAAVLGGEAMAGPIGLAIAAVTGFAAVLHDATQTAGEFRRATTMTGGTAAQTAAISAMGIAPGQQAGAAAGLREKLSTDPQAVMFAQRFLGIGPQIRRGYGEVNEARLLQQVLTQLRGLGQRDPESQLRVARELGLEGFLDRLRVSEPIWQAMLKDAAITEEVMGRNSQAFRDLEGSSSRAATAFSNLGVVIGGQLAPAVGLATGQIAETINGLLAGVNWMSRQREGSFAEQFNRRLEEQQRQQNPQAATEKNTEAVNENTRALTQGMSGGGPLARGAFPAGLRGPQVAAALEHDRLKLGVF